MYLLCALSDGKTRRVIASGTSSQPPLLIARIQLFPENAACRVVTGILEMGVTGKTRAVWSTR